MIPYRLQLIEEGLIEPEVKRRKYGPDPVAQEDRLRALHEVYQNVWVSIAKIADI